MIRDYLNKLQARESFSEAEAYEVMSALLTGELTDAQIAALLIGFALKGETAEELTGFARVMRQHAVTLRTSRRPLIDTAGTGGGVNTFNISTTAAFVIAGAGLAVAKHGNTSFTSRCGSADVLRALGVRIDTPTAIVERCLDEVGIAFLFAPCFHPAMKRVAAVRKQLGVRTVFNLLGPLNNPAAAEFQVLGVYQETLTERMAEALSNLGTTRAWVVHSADGMDEVSACGPTKVTELDRGRITSFYISPKDIHMDCADAAELVGGESTYNANVTFGVLSGRIKTGPRLAVLLNAAAGLLVTGAAMDFREALDKATESIDSRAALKKLEDLIRLTNLT